MAGPADPRDRDAALVAAERIARIMDGWYLDPILGLLPGAGDLVSAGIGLYPLLLAWRRGAPASLIARMLLNLTVDLVSGAVPVVGDVFDFFFRAHRRNLDLLRVSIEMGTLKGSPYPPAMDSAGRSPAPSTRSVKLGQVRGSRSDALVVAGALTLFLAALSIPVVLLVLVFRAVLS